MRWSGLWAATRALLRCPAKALQKQQRTSCRRSVLHSMQAIRTTTCWQLSGHCKHGGFNSNELSCNRSQRALQNPFKSVLNDQSKGERWETAHKAQCMRNAGLQGAVDAKVCMGLKKQTNSQLKSLHWVQFNAGLHLPLGVWARNQCEPSKVFWGEFYMRVLLL